MNRRTLTFFLLSVLLLAPMRAQEVTEQWVKDHYTKREVMIEMRDGVRLFTAIYEPRDTSTKRPILMTRTPYSCSPYGEGFSRSLWGSMKLFTKDQYIIVFQDVRGKSMSEGDFINVRPYNPNKKKKETDEASDSYDTVDWLVKNTACNGSVGAFGVSYPGFYATMVGLSGHPAVKAVSPQAPVTDWYHGDDVHHNGAFMLVDTYSFMTFFDRPRQGPGMMRMPMGERDLRFANDIYGDYLRMGPIPAFTESYGDSILFWPDIIGHPDLDDFWQARDPRNFVYNVKPAVMVVGGLFDAEDCFGAWYLYRAIQEKSPETPLYLAMGPWYHGAWHSSGYQNLGQTWFGGNTADWFMAEVEYPFFSYYLDGKGEAPKAGVNMFYTGSNEWRQYDSWPLQEEQPTPLYLRAGGKLTWEAPSETDSHTDYVSDPNHPVPYTASVQSRRNREYMAEDQRFASYRPDVLTFRSEPLTDTLTLGGPVDVELEVAISTTDADFVVKLIDVYPDGFSYVQEFGGPMGGGAPGQQGGPGQQGARQGAPGAGNQPGQAAAPGGNAPGASGPGAMPAGNAPNGGNPGAMPGGNNRNGGNPGAMPGGANRSAGAQPTGTTVTLPDRSYPMGGYQMLVRGDIMRGKYRESFETPIPFRPGEVTTVRYRLPDVAHRFLPGHRVMIQVQSSWFPLADRNPQTFTNIYLAKPEDFVSSEIHVHHERDHASRVILPVIK